VAIPARRRKDRTRIRTADIVRVVGWVAPDVKIRVRNGRGVAVVVAVEGVDSRAAIRTVNGAAGRVVDRGAVQAAAAAPE